MGVFEDASYERRVELLLARLPNWISALVRWLRQPRHRGMRFLIGGLFLAGGCLFFLPLLGAWMLPLGLVILADDVPLFRRWAAALLNWVERKHPRWLGL